MRLAKGDKHYWSFSPVKALGLTAQKALSDLLIVPLIVPTRSFLVVFLSCLVGKQSVGGSKHQGRAPHCSGYSSAPAAVVHSTSDPKAKLKAHDFA